LLASSPADFNLAAAPSSATATPGGTASYAVSVLSVAAPADFAIPVSPSSITVYRGKWASYTVSVSSVGGFTGQVSLTVTGRPSGSSTSLSANPVTAPGTATLTVKTTGWTTRGTFTLVVTGTSGSLVHQATVTLIVR